jgi:predicted dehydrogenase
VLSASVANRAHPETPGLQDVGDMHLATDTATGTIRVDWFTPDGLPTWGDGRLIIVGTEGTIELRKYVDIAGRPGGDHLFLFDKAGVRHIDCSGGDLPFGRQLIADIRDRTETAMPQARAFKAMEIALTAQALAEETSQWSAR